LKCEYVIWVQGIRIFISPISVPDINPGSGEEIYYQTLSESTSEAPHRKCKDCGREAVAGSMTAREGRCPILHKFPF
jgi:hypothetical protein